MKKYIINVNGNSYEVEVEEVVEEKAMSKPATSKLKAAPVITKIESAPRAKDLEGEKLEKEKLLISQDQEVVEAPMPGNIWKMIVKEGQEVTAGEVLLILEAMKMENEILAPRDGIVSKINTSEGSAVNTGDKLVILD